MVEHSLSKVCPWVGNLSFMNLIFSTYFKKEMLWNIKKNWHKLSKKSLLLVPKTTKTLRYFEEKSTLLSRGLLEVLETILKRNCLCLQRVHGKFTTFETKEKLD